MNKTILFGGSGFLGPVILKKNPDIISIGRTKPPLEIKNEHIHLKSLDNLQSLDSIEFDKVIFLIGSSNHHEINKSITMGLDYNLYPTKKILNYLSKRKIKKFISFSSILLYDVNKIKLPVNEKQDINPFVNDYVFSKYLSEEVVKFFYNKVPSIIIRLSNVYGYTRLIRPDFVPALIRKSLLDKEIKIWSDKPKRDFIYSEDASDAIIKLLDTDYTGILNLGTGTMSSCSEIVSIIEKLSGKKVISEDKKVWGPMEFNSDITLLRKLTNWKPKHSLEEGLEKTYNIMKNY